jgi:hypothetical protein
MRYLRIFLLAFAIASPAWAESPTPADTQQASTSLATDLMQLVIQLRAQIVADQRAIVACMKPAEPEPPKEK